MENRLYPLRELLGDLLLEAGQAKAAVRAYRDGARRTRRTAIAGSYGAAMAAQASGDRDDGRRGLHETGGAGPQR